MIQCKNCNEILTNINTYKNYRNTKKLCKNCWMKYIKNYRKTHSRKMEHTKRSDKLKLEVLKNYSETKNPMCVKCNFSDIRALSIDHTNNDGAKHRREIGKNNIYQWLRKNNYPKDFQTLCMNCQFIKELSKRRNG